jgi:hypothetical protein
MSIRSARPPACKPSVTAPEWQQSHFRAITFNGADDRRPLQKAFDAQLESTPFIHLQQDIWQLIFDLILKDDNGTITIPGLVCTGNVAKTCNFFRFLAQDLVKTPFDVRGINANFDFKIETPTHLVADTNPNEQRCLVRKRKLENALKFPLYSVEYIDGEDVVSLSKLQLFILRDTVTNYKQPTTPLRIYLGFDIVYKADDYCMLVQLPTDEFVRIFSGQSKKHCIYDPDDGIHRFRSVDFDPITGVELLEGDKFNLKHFDLAISVSSRRCYDAFVPIEQTYKSPNGDGAALSRIRIDTSTHMVDSFNCKSVHLGLYDFQYFCDLAGRQCDTGLSRCRNDVDKNGFITHSELVDKELDKFGDVSDAIRQSAITADIKTQECIELVENATNYNGSVIANSALGQEIALRADDSLGVDAQLIDHTDSYFDNSDDEEYEEVMEEDEEKEESESKSEESEESEEESEEEEEEVQRPSKRPRSYVVDSDDDSDEDVDTYVNTAVNTTVNTTVNTAVPAMPAVSVAVPLFAPVSASIVTVRVFETPQQAYKFVDERTREHRRPESIQFQIGSQSFLFRDFGSSRKWHVERNNRVCSKKGELLEFLA